MAKLKVLGLFLIVLHSVTGFAQDLQPPFSFEFQKKQQKIRDEFAWVFERPEPAPVDTANVWLKWNIVENYHYGKDRGSLPMIADLSSLHPYFRDQIIELVNQCHRKGIELAVVEAYRTHAKQNEYKSMGKKYTRSAGGYSKHQYGLAVDVVPIVDSVAQWDNHALWRKVGVIGERLGLRWGGRWRHPYDPGHFEWTGGLSSHHFAQGKFPALPAKAHYPCLEEDLALLQRYWKQWEIEQSLIVSRKKEATNTAMK